MDGSDAEPLEDDVVLLLQACSNWLGDQVLDRVRTEAGDAVRYGDGYVFQHLIPGPMSITALAHRLGVTQQAASKQVADMEARRLVRRRQDPADGRAKLVELSNRGWRVVRAGRAARRELGDQVSAALGERKAAALLRSLRELSDHTGAVEHMAQRRLRPESSR
jgi:DNA-binding MarR family transcriptional regulator